MITDKDKTKALDAIIVAIGIVSVLITNVSYVGYLTTPGGPEPYWFDCDHPMFTAYIYFNGFAMVFSIAAIAVVTFGPFVLVIMTHAGCESGVVASRYQPHHTAGRLQGRFACAGFVVALVESPPLKCAYLKCGDGGIRCDLYGTRSPGSYSLLYDVDYEFVLDPKVEYLDQDMLFGPTSKRSLATQGSFTCCNYPYIQISNDSDP